MLYQIYKNLIDYTYPKTETKLFELLKHSAHFTKEQPSEIPQFSEYARHLLRLLKVAEDNLTTAKTNHQHKNSRFVMKNSLITFLDLVSKESSNADCQTYLLELLKEYYDCFSGSYSCFDEMKPYFELLDDNHRRTLMETLPKVKEGSVASKILTTINYLKLQFYLTSVLTPEELRSIYLLSLIHI
eukprot:TRINITY_DN23377_c0_g1_i1.p1 TRINITY_DN23377_c0_g1~~TRINITY_DN23377_c0_g1_i1.p1  ORF type:complete len:186 (-),score=21.03 TRINITY_DN23377_c0_g1_i1:61-618(-)